MACSMARQAGRIIRARRSRPRRAPSMRARSPVASSSASSSSRSSSRRASASSGASTAASARGRGARRSRAPGPAPGRAAHSCPTSDGAARARSCSSTATRKASIGPIGLASPEGGAMRPDQPSPGRAAAARTACGERLAGVLALADQLGQPRLQAPPAPAAPLRPADPAAQLGGLGAGEGGGEGRVGGVEQVVALVEDDALERGGLARRPSAPAPPGRRRRRPGSAPGRGWRSPGRPGARRGSAFSMKQAR